MKINCYLSDDFLKMDSTGSGGGSLKLKNFEGDGDEKFGVKGGYLLENSSVLVHLFTTSGQFYYFS